MKQPWVLFTLLSIAWPSAFAQETTNEAIFRLALPASRGQLSWRADGYTIVESSAKANGREVGLRGKDQSGRLTFLGFLFRVDEPAPISSANCRDDVLALEKKSNPTLKIASTSEIDSKNRPLVTVVSYMSNDRSGKTWYVARGFVASGDICGDLEFYSNTLVNADDPTLKQIFETYQLDSEYVPQFKDVFLYGEILYKHEMYKAAAPIFEQALSMLPDDNSQETMRRVTIDQAGMAYGISGDFAKARAIFNAAIAKDPEYPMYYYNLACADAEQNDLVQARVHLQQAFDRKQNVLLGEALPNPAKDDSFLPHRTNKEFWRFVESLH
jgi:tetratricopeptide (TPR) repeat protein